MKERIDKKLRSWHNKILSSVGKAMLIQSFAQAIPLHHMYCYKLSKDFLHELNMALARFWWGGTEEKRKAIGIIWTLFAVQNLMGV